MTGARAAWARLAGLAALVAALVGAVALSGVSAADVRGWAHGLGAAGPVVFVAVSAALTVALFPGPVLAGASGVLFGTALGTAVSIVAATLGAALAFALARTVAHDAAERLATGRLAALRAAAGRRGFLSVLYARLVPGLPYTAVNYAAGLAPIRPAAFVAATAIGCAPRAFAYTALGGSLGHLDRPEAKVAVAVLVVFALAGLALARRDVRRARAARAPGSGTGSSCPAGRSAARP